MLRWLLHWLADFRSREWCRANMCLDGCRNTGLAVLVDGFEDGSNGTCLDAP